MYRAIRIERGLITLSTIAPHSPPRVPPALRQAARLCLLQMSALANNYIGEMIVKTNIFAKRRTPLAEAAATLRCPGLNPLEAGELEQGSCREPTGCRDFEMVVMQRVLFDKNDWKLLPILQ